MSDTYWMAGGLLLLLLLVAFLFLAAHIGTLGAPGVYAVFAPREWTSRFKTRGRFENVIEPWSQERLRRRWIDGVDLQALEPLAGADLLNCIERPSAGEHRETAEQHPLSLVE